MKQNKTFTAASVREFIAQRMESDLPDRVIEALRPFNGKPITTRLLAALPALPDGGKWYLKRQYGWTALESSTYCTPKGYADKTSISLILTRTEASVPLDVEYVAGNVPMGGATYGENAAYFAARRERNHKRMEASNIIEECSRAARILNRYQAAVEELEAARVEFEELTEYSGYFNPDNYALRDMVDPHNKAGHEEKK
jgi:hypothetical protein